MFRKNLSKRKSGCLDNDSDCLFSKVSPPAEEMDSGGGGGSVVGLVGNSEILSDFSESIQNVILNTSTSAAAAVSSTANPDENPQNTFEFLTFYKNINLNISAINLNNAPAIYNLLHMNFNSSYIDKHSYNNHNNILGSSNNMAVIDNSDMYFANNLPIDEEVDISPFSEFGNFYRHSTGMTVVYCVLYVIVFIVGLIGNFFVISVVLRAPRMRTVTNFFIANLAIADILVIVFCLPATLMGNIFVRKYFITFPLLIIIY